MRDGISTREDTVKLSLLIFKKTFFYEQENMIELFICGQFNTCQQLEDNVSSRATQLLVWIAGVAWITKWKSVAALSCWFEAKYVKRSSLVMKGNGSGIVFVSNKVADPRRQCVLLILRQQNQAVYRNVFITLHF